MIAIALIWPESLAIAPNSASRCGVPVLVHLPEVFAAVTVCTCSA